MKFQTIHGNPLGEVVNPSSAIGFRLEDDHGKWIEARVVDGALKVEWGVPLSPPCSDEYVATKLDDPMGQQYGRILRDPPRQLVDYQCPVKFGEFDHGHPTEEQLIAAAKPEQGS